MSECCNVDFLTKKRCNQRPIAKISIIDSESKDFKICHKVGDTHHFACINHAPVQIAALTMVGPWEWESIPINEEDAMSDD